MGGIAVHNVTVYPSLARTTLQNGATINDGNHPRLGGLFFFNATAIGAAPSVTPTIQGFDPGSGLWYDILVGAAKTATGLTILRVYPGMTAAANLVANDFLPPQWRINVAVGNADSMTYSITALLR